MKPSIVTPLVHEGLGERVYKTIRDLILGQLVSPGSKLNVEQLCRDLGVSRTPETVARQHAARVLALAGQEGIFCGISSGCNVAAAIKLARRHPELPSIVTVINDTGQRYFSTPLCGEATHVEIPERAHPLDDHTLDQLDRYQPGWELIA